MAIIAVIPGPEASAQTKSTLTLSSAQAAAGIDEGQQITFTVTSVQHVSADLRVPGVAESGGNFIGAEGTRGRRGVIKAGTSTVAFFFTIHDNDIDEVDGYVRMRINPDPGYELSTSMAKVAVRDNDPAPAAINAALEQKVFARIESRRHAQRPPEGA